MRNDLRPSDSEAVQIFSQSVCIVRACLPTSRNTEQPASGIGEGARISADSNNTCELLLPFGLTRGLKSYYHGQDN